MNVMLGVVCAYVCDALTRPISRHERYICWVCTRLKIHTFITRLSARPHKYYYFGERETCRRRPHVYLSLEPSVYVRCIRNLWI